MTLSSIAALFGTMILLAMIPGPSVFAVVARSLSSGFIQGLVTVWTLDKQQNDSQVPIANIFRIINFQFRAIRPQSVVMVLAFSLF